MASAIAKATMTGFHDAVLATSNEYFRYHWDTKFNYTFENFFHPFTGELIARLNEKGLPGLMDAAWQESLSRSFFSTFYTPINSQLVSVKSFDKEIDVREEGPYANYNWELFFHIPFTAAVHLSKTQRFAEAQRWFHYIFDPTSNDHSVPPLKRFWKFLAFRKDKDPKQIDELLALLSKSPSELSDEDKETRDNILAGYNAILNNPFQPHKVARTRHVAYQYAVVMKYLDNLIAWGDSLFQQDTTESINEATQRYVLAANILGPRPQQIPPSGTVQAKTFAQLKALPYDAMGNAIVELEGQFPFNYATSSADVGDGANTGPLFGIGRTLYFCIPRNDKLLSYWDTVADRLFKIRNCMNIAGIVRPLALFDPPLDPGMLVKAAAAGIDVGSIVSGLNQPIGPTRCMTLIQKALELCSEVKALGSSLLSALEKKDGESLAALRQTHEIAIQEIVKQVRFLQLKSAQESTISLKTTRASALEKFKYYQRALGLQKDKTAPDTIDIKSTDLNTENFDDAFSKLVGQFDQTVTQQLLPALQIDGSNSPQQQSGDTGTGVLYLIANEAKELNTHLPTAKDIRIAASLAETAAPILSLIPDVKVNLHFWGLGGSTNVFGGSKLASGAKFAAEILRIVAGAEQDKAGMTGRTAGHQRRADDWKFQSNLAAHELKQIGRQILTSLIAEQVAQHELDNATKQIENSQEVDRFLHEKFTNEELYTWMQGEISRLYYEYYRLAFDTARKAERTMKQELMRPELDTQDFVKFNYWDGGRKGLLSGEALHLDLKRMELAYHENNKRELELTRHVSLRQLDLVALLTLRGTGTCQLTVPEWLYDRDCPGHYMRRIKSVGISVPSVVRPYTGVHCTLSLLKSSIRKSAILKDSEYARQGSEDDRFIDYTGAVQSIVTSGGNNDSGMFETNLREERFLPFENAGAVSTWKLDLPRDHPAFDYSTISDVILHVRYTARQGVDASKVKTALDDLFGEATLSGAKLAMAFSLRHDFPSEWSAFVNSTQDFRASIGRDYFPYFTQGRTVTINSLELYSNDGTKHHATGDPDAATTGLADNNAFVYSAAADTAGPTQILTRSARLDVYLLVRYTLT